MSRNTVPFNRRVLTTPTAVVASIKRYEAKQERRVKRESLTEERQRAKLDREESNSMVAMQEDGWHEKHPELVLGELGSNFELGLTSQEAAERLALYGENRLRAAPRKSLLDLLIEQFTNVIVVILIFASAASMAFGEYVEGGVILAIVVINAIVSVMQELSADDALAALKNMSAPEALVRRDGQLVQVPATEVVPGDVVRVVVGDIVPADIRLFRTADLACEEKALTGESVDVHKRGDYNPMKMDEDVIAEPENDQELVPRTREMRGLKTASESDSSPEVSGAETEPSEAHDIHERPNVIFASTNVTNGNGEGVVFATGMKTRIGKIAALLGDKNELEAERVLMDEAERNELEREEDEEERERAERKETGCFAAMLEGEGTPLQRALHRLGIYMGFGALGLCVLVFIVGTLIGHKDPAHGDNPVWLQMIMVSVSLAVSGVPEGLPACVTITLSAGMSSMIERHCLVRTLPAVETLGSATVICTDKTGTLTAGEMTAKALAVGDKKYRVEGNGFEIKGGIVEEMSGTNVCEPEHREPLVDAAVIILNLCNTANLQSDPEMGENAWKAVGGSTERPLVVLGAKAGLWPDQVREQYPLRLENAYSSSRKMMSTVHEVPAEADLRAQLKLGTPFVAAVKGAPNYVVERSDFVQRLDGTVEPMTPEERVQITAQIDRYSDEAFRVLAIAYRPLDAVPARAETKVAECETGLTFVGLVASLDPERPEVIAAIQEARNAGVRTVMITGDYINTARAIAKNINLVDVRDLTEAAARAKVAAASVDCNVLRKTDERTGRPLVNENGDYVYKSAAEIDAITAHVSVFARAQPQDKYEIVKSLQDRQNEVCAMTGDGVNDAPALKEAAIGVAMGKAGTETAKQAANMVLTDDNFTSIVAAIHEGRRIYANIKAFASFLLSTNAAELIIISLMIFISLPSPLEPLQILLLNLASDGLPALALSREPAADDIMSEPPRPKKQNIIHGPVWFGIIFNSVALMATIMIVYMVGLSWHTDDMWHLGEDDEDGVAQARTMSFITITLSEYMRAYTVRSQTKSVFRRDIFANNVLQICVAVSASFLSIVIFTPGVQDVFGFVPLEGRDWGLVLGTALLPLVATEIAKIYLRSKKTEKKLSKLGASSKTSKSFHALDDASVAAVPPQQDVQMDEQV